MKKIVVKLDRLIGLFKQISMQFKWQQPLINHFAALTYTLNKKDFDKDNINDLRKYIKKNTGIFSYYRGTPLMMLASLLASTYNNPIREFDKVLNYSKKMKAVGFKKSIYLPIASYAILATCKEQHVDMRIDKAILIYKEIRKKHRLITSGDDYSLSILLANSNYPVDSIIDSVEECFKLLYDNGFQKNSGIQFLSYMLGFSKEENTIKVLRCKKVFNTLKENTIKVYYGDYAIIGLLSLLDEEESVNQVIGILEILKKDKKYKWLTKETYLYTAAALVCDAYIEKMKNKYKKGITQNITIGIPMEVLIQAQMAATIAKANGVTKSSKGKA